MPPSQPPPSTMFSAAVSISDVAPRFRAPNGEPARVLCYSAPGMEHPGAPTSPGGAKVFRCSLHPPAHPLTHPIAKKHPMLSIKEAMILAAAAGNDTTATWKIISSPPTAPKHRHPDRAHHHQPPGGGWRCCGSRAPLHCFAVYLSGFYSGDSFFVDAFYASLAIFAGLGNPVLTAKS